jgi:transcriptional regulator with XRE-family HTH domain
MVVRLVDWRKQMDWTQERLASELGVTQPYVSTMERARNPAVPGPGLMIEIFVLSRGAVRPDDFYELPALTGDRLSEAA